MPSGMSKENPAKMAILQLCAVQAKALCEIKSQTFAVLGGQKASCVVTVKVERGEFAESRIITFLVFASYLQGRLNVKAVWGHTDLPFAVHLR